MMLIEFIIGLSQSVRLNFLHDIGLIPDAHQTWHQYRETLTSINQRKLNEKQRKWIYRQYNVHVPPGVDTSRNFFCWGGGGGEKPKN